MMVYLIVLERLRKLLENGFEVTDFPASPMPSGIEDTLTEMFQDYPEAQSIKLTKKTLCRIAYAYARENADEILGSARNLIEEFADFAASVDLRSHHAKLLRLMYPENIFSQLCTMKWTIQDLQNDIAVLPDCIGIMSENGIDFVPLLGGVNSARIIAISITPTKLLIGSRKIDFNFEGHEFNNHAANCSNEFFISNKKNQSLMKLQGSLGKKNKTMLVGVIEQTISDFSVRFSRNATSISVIQPEETQPFKFSIHFPIGFSETQTYDQIKGIGEDIISMFSSQNLKMLSSLHFDDHSAATLAYTEKFVDQGLRSGSQKLRSDGICAVIPDGVKLGKYKLYINYQVLDLYSESGEQATAIDYVRKAESDLMLSQVFDDHDAAQFSILDQLFVTRAIRSLRAYNRARFQRFSSVDLSRIAEDAKSHLLLVWNRKEIEDIASLNESIAHNVDELLERMSYSMLVVSEFSALAGVNLNTIAANVCDSPEFIKWINLFDKDMRLALRWLDDGRASDSALIAAAHLERLMFGVGLMFEIGEDGNLRYEWRGGFPETALPMPFGSLLEAVN